MLILNLVWVLNRHCKLHPRTHEFKLSFCLRSMSNWVLQMFSIDFLLCYNVGMLLCICVHVYQFNNIYLFLLYIKERKSRLPCIGLFNSSLPSFPSGCWAQTHTLDILDQWTTIKLHHQSPYLYFLKYCIFYVMQLQLMKFIFSIQVANAVIYKDKWEMQSTEFDNVSI